MQSCQSVLHTKGWKRTKTKHCGWIKDVRALIGPIKKCFWSLNIPPSLLQTSRPRLFASLTGSFRTWKPLWVIAAPQLVFALPGVPFIDKSCRLQELTAHSSICHSRMGVKIAGGLWVRNTVTGSGGLKGSVGAADSVTWKTCSVEPFLRSAFSIGSGGFCVCFLWSVFGA